MALHKITITVVDGGKSEYRSSGDEQEKSKGNPYKKTAYYKILNLNETIRNKIEKQVTPTTFFAMQSAVSVATKTARQFVNYYISDIGRRNGDSNYQAVVNRRIEQVTDVLGVAGSTLGGAASGAALGPVGAVVGAAAGLVTSAVDLGFKYAERGRDYAHQMFQESNNQAYNLARAGVTALTGRLR